MDKAFELEISNSYLKKSVALCCVKGGEQMDKEIMELLEQSIAERSQIAFMEMREAHPRLDALVEELVALSQKVENHTDISAGNKELIQRYLSRAAEADSKFQKYLYIQGARDCVALLRELGVIK